MQKASLSPMLKSWGLPPNFLPSSSDTNARNTHPHLLRNSPPSDENAPTTAFLRFPALECGYIVCCGLELRGKAGRLPKDKERGAGVGKEKGEGWGRGSGREGGIENCPPVNRSSVSEAHPHPHPSPHPHYLHQPTLNTHPLLPPLLPLKHNNQHRPL
jgi:hypothetical protein